MNNSQIAANLYTCNSRRHAMLSVFTLLTASACGGGSSDSAASVTSGTFVQTAAEVVAAMGVGFNLGNTFDNGLQSTDPALIYPLIDLYVNAGMKHIRIPVTWTELVPAVNGTALADKNTGEVNTNHPRFMQLKSVVDYALTRNLYVVINAHHEDWLYSSYSGSSTEDAVFSSLWTDIATQFADRPQRLIFEILNEPQGVFGNYSNGSAVPSSTSALALTRQINRVGYDAIRATGGANLKRVIMVSSNAMGNQKMMLSVYPNRTSLPGGGSDTALALHVHTYDPWGFCGQTGSNSAWPGESAITTPMLALAAHARTLRVPVNYGEFGVGRSTNSAERNTDLVRNYYRTMVSTCLSEEMAPSVWDDRGWFGLVASNGIGGYAFTNQIVPTIFV
jgi:endoglucanase